MENKEIKNELIQGALFLITLSWIYYKLSWILLA